MIVFNAKIGETSHTLTADSEEIRIVQLKSQLERFILINAQKWIYKGRILNDDATLAECQLKSGDTVIVIRSTRPSQASTPVDQSHVEKGGEDIQEISEICDQLNGCVHKLVLKAISAIQNFPDDPKFRSMKLANKAVLRLWEDNNAKAIMAYVGFVVDDGLWKFSTATDISNLAKVCAFLKTRGEREVIDTGLTDESFSRSESHTAVSLDAQGQCSLHIAAARGDYHQCVALMQLSPSLALIADCNGWLPLHEAVRGNHVVIATLLITEGGPLQLTHRTSNGANALWWANHFKNAEIVELLAFLNVEELGPASSPVSHAVGGFDREEQEAADERVHEPEECVPACMTCNRALVQVHRQDSMLFRAPRPNAACYCKTCKAAAGETASSNAGSATSGNSHIFVICGECFNSGGHSHDQSHQFGLVGADQSSWRGSNGRAPPPPPPNARNRRGAWG